MKNKYDEIMEKIKVTDEMRTRILKNLSEAEPENRPGKTIRSSFAKKYLCIAASAILLLCSALLLPQLLTDTDSRQPESLATGGIVEAASLEQLSEDVGFPVQEAELPFVPEERVYLSYWDEMAEIVYTGESQEAVFRKSQGAEDNSGDYNEYTVVEKRTVGGIPVTFKGDSDMFTLAIWSDRGFSYSLRLSAGVNDEVWEMILTEINKT